MAWLEWSAHARLSSAIDRLQVPCLLEGSTSSIFVLHWTPLPHKGVFCFAVFLCF